MPAPPIHRGWAWLCAAAGALLLAGLSIATPASATEPCPRPDPTIAEAVKELSYELYYDEKSARLDEIQKLFLRRPREAACSLVAELKVVRGRIIFPFREEEARFASAMHMIEVIRALRLITGCLDFRAETKDSFKRAKYGPDPDSERESDERRRYFLREGGPGVGFFANWMSRGINYIAAPDAQRAIIRKWNDWLATSEGFRFSECENFDDWFF
jgi:hypothetical protein